MRETAWCFLHEELEPFTFVLTDRKVFNEHVERRVQLECGREQYVVRPRSEGEELAA